MTAHKDGSLIELAIDLINLPEYQPRKDFDQCELLELGTNIQAVGLIQPISVRLVDGRYILVAGERRYRSCQLVGKKTITAYVSGSNDVPILTLMKQLSENIHRCDLTPLEVAETIYIYQHEYNMSLNDIVATHGGHKSKWSRYSKINSACDLLREAIRDRVITSVNVISHLVDIQEHDLDLLRETLAHIRDRSFTGKVERYTQDLVARIKAESKLGYLPPMPDGNGQFDESHTGVRLEQWQGEYGVKFTFKFLQTKLNEWVGGYRVVYGGANVDLPLSTAYKGKSLDELKEHVYEPVLAYLSGLKERHNNEYHIADFNRLIKHLTLPGKEEIHNFATGSSKGKGGVKELDIKAEDVSREDNYLVIKVNGGSARVPVELLRALL